MRATSYSLLLVLLLVAPARAQRWRPPSAANVTRYRITDLGAFGPVAINARGQVAGTGSDAAGHPRAVLWTDGALRDLGALSSGFAWATGLNDAGQVVGQSLFSSQDEDPRRGLAVAVRFPPAAQVLGGLSTADGAAAGINAAGDTVGYTLTGGGGHQTPTRWAAGSATAEELSLPGNGDGWATAINTAGVIVGSARLATGPVTGFVALRWEGGAVTVLPALTADAGGDATALNDLGVIVGTSAGQAVRWVGGRVQALGIAGTPTGVNLRGQIVGQAQAGGAWLWETGQLVDLTTRLVDGVGWQLLGAQSVNALGQIVGTGTHNGQRRGYLLTPLLLWTR